jgi:hypothetical protein
MQNPLKFFNISKSCLETKIKPYFKHSDLKVGNRVDGLSSLFSDFEIALNGSFKITKTFEDLKMNFFSTLFSIRKRKRFLFLDDVGFALAALGSHFSAL